MSNYFVRCLAVLTVAIAVGFGASKAQAAWWQWCDTTKPWPCAATPPCPFTPASTCFAVGKTAGTCLGTSWVWSCTGPGSCPAVCSATGAPCPAIVGPPSSC